VRVDLLFQKAVEAGIDIQVCCMPAPFLLDPHSINQRSSEIVTIGKEKENVASFLSINVLLLACLGIKQLKGVNLVQSVAILPHTLCTGN